MLNLPPAYDVQCRHLQIMWGNPRIGNHSYYTSMDSGPNLESIRIKDLQGTIYQVIGVTHSKINEIEIFTAIRLADNYVKAEFKSESIVILTPCVARRACGVRLLVDFPHLKGITIATIEEYPGKEENMAILSVTSVNYTFSIKYWSSIK